MPVLDASITIISVCCCIYYFIYQHYSILGVLINLISIELSPQGDSLHSANHIRSYSRTIRLTCTAQLIGLQPALYNVTNKVALEKACDLPCDSSARVLSSANFLRNELSFPCFRSFIIIKESWAQASCLNAWVIPA